MDESEQFDGALAARHADSGEAPSIVEFQHRFFSLLEGAYFKLIADTDEPVYVVRLSENEFALPFPGIVREFEIDADSADGRMLRVVAEALKYVKILRLGDPLPSEVLTGQASWEVSEQHRHAAYQRITIQLATWLSGGERLVTGVEELNKLAEDPKIKDKVTEAFSEAARQLDLDSVEAVITLIEELAEELAYIEALRGRFKEILGLSVKVRRLTGQYRRELSIWEIASSVYRLLEIAIDEFQHLFNKVDSETGEIMTVLRNIEAQVGFIREIRDDLYRRLRAWDETLSSWRALDKGEWGSEQDTLRATYRFLAIRFTPTDEWELFTKLQELDGPQKPKSAMIW